ncbi:MAG: PAS domain S-box protein [Prolixibacteraceae bacterium]|nr:PAS domain S-box protein [Prolixibacteraceae bacterium]
MDSSMNSQTNSNLENQTGENEARKLNSLTKDELLRIIHEYEIQDAKLQTQIKDLILKEENAKKVSEKFRILGDLITEMLDLGDLSSIYNYITLLLHKHIPDSIILFNSVDDKEKIVKLESISGINNRLLNKLLKVWGINPIGKKFKLISTHDNYFRSGRFVEFEGNLETFSASDLSPIVARTIEKIIGLHKIYTIGIKKDTNLLAAIHFFTFNKNVIYDRTFIEAFIKQAGIVIQKKLIEKDLKESEEKYRNIFENVQDVYYEATMDGTILEISPSIEIFTKGLITRTELLGKSPHDFFTIETDSSQFIKFLKEHREVSSYEVSLKNKNGTHISCLVSAKLILDNKGLPVKIIGSINDISERKKIEDELKISEEKYRDIFKNSPVGIWEEDFSKVKERFVFLKNSGVNNFRKFLDSNPSEIRYLASLVKVLSVNNVSLKMLGCNTKEQFVETLNNFLIEESMPVFKEEMIALEAGERHYECEIPVLTAKGQKRLFQLSLAVPKNYKNTLSRVLVSFLDITERRQADEKLRESEKRYRSLFDKMQEGFALHEIICDEHGNPKDYRFLDINPAFEKLTGLRADEIHGKTVLELMPETESFWIEKYGEVALTGAHIQFENYSQALEKYFHVVAFSPGKNQFATMFADITESKLSEIRLLQTKESYFDVFNSVAEAIYIQDGKTGVFLDINKGAELMYGYSREELIGQSPATVAAPGMNDLKSIVQKSEHVFSTGEPCHFEFWAVRKNGEIYPKEVHLNKGRYFGSDVLIATARDITENKLAQEQLVRQARFRQLLIEISSTFINLPLEKIDVSINNALEEMGRFAGVDRVYIFDFDDETGLCTNTYEWCEQGIEPQIDFLQNIPLSDDWIASFRKGNVIYIDDVLSLPEGETKSVLEPQGIKSLIAVPMTNCGLCIGFIGFDSVNQHHTYSDTDQQLLTISAQLLVNIKLRKQSDENILKAKEKAEESDRLKSAFLANMSHEIRTPLNSIIGFSELMTDPDFNSEQQKEFAQMINDSGTNLLSIITDIMDFSKMEAGQVQINQSEFFVDELITDIQREFSYKATAKGIELKLNLLNEPQKILMVSDVTKIRQVLNNLVGNAMKFTNSGYIEIGVRTDDQQIEFYVRDTGIGIPEKYHHQLFKRFSQIESFNTRKYGGNGLGLAISKSLVELLGGKIWMESEEGNGSTFYFTVPK